MDRFRVKAAPRARQQLHEWKIIAKHSPQSAEGLAYSTVKAGIERVVSDPNHAGDKQFRLVKDLIPVYRFKCGPDSRYRVFYIFSAEKETAIVLHIGYRRELANRRRSSAPPPI